MALQRLSSNSISTLGYVPLGAKLQSQLDMSGCLCARLPSSWLSECKGPADAACGIPILLAVANLASSSPRQYDVPAAGAPPGHWPS